MILKGESVWSRGLGQAIAFTTKTSTTSSSSAVTQSVEDLNRALLRSVLADTQGLCRGLGGGPECSSQHIKFNDTPFRRAVRSSMQTLKAFDDRAVRDLIEPLTALLVEKSTLSAADIRGHLAEDAKRLGVSVPSSLTETTISSNLSSVSSRISPLLSAQVLPAQIPTSPATVDVVPGFGPMPGELPPNIPGTVYPGTSYPDPTQYPEYGTPGVVVPEAEGDKNMLLYAGVGAVALGGLFFFLKKRKK